MRDSLQPPGTRSTEGEKPTEAAPPKKHPGGRPTKYKKKFCEAIIKYFSQATTKIEKVTQITKAGVTSYDLVVANPLPLFSAFARSIGVDENTLLNWTTQHPEFLGAYTHAKALQKEFLIENGMAGRYDTKFAMFVAVNATDMRDKVDHTHQNPDGSNLFQFLDRCANRTKGIPSDHKR